LVGIWSRDEGFQIVELLFRSDGRYQIETKSTDPVFDTSFTDRGTYAISGPTLTLTPYEYFGDPGSKRYLIELNGEMLTLVETELDLTYVYQLKAGSRSEVLAREKVALDLIATWERTITFAGKAEYTFRPGGYYVLKNTPEGSQFPPDYIRGRYEQTGNQLTLKPYSGVEARFELDFFGSTLTLIRQEEFSGDSTSYEQIAGSGADVRAKAAEADAFLSRPNWQVGVWELRDDRYTVDLTLRPDGHYSSTNAVELLRGFVRGRYALEGRRLRLAPFIGQGIYSRDNGDFGKVERARELDYFDGELQLIDLEAISQSVALARKRPGSEATVLAKTQEAEAEREREGWQVGAWEVHDPTGWMQVTFRPDNRYIALAGTDSAASQVERGRYLLRGDKVTLAPYPGLGQPRGFELDLYDGDLLLAGDLNRIVVARKVPGSENVVIQKTRDPDALKGERGTILGLWTANLPGASAELVFRPDGQFRLDRCWNSVVSQDYGLYTVDMASRKLVYDSRFAPIQTLEMDFYGDTLTLFGGIQSPSTYTVNLGVVDAAIAASQAADEAESQVDAQWLARIPIRPRDPNAIQIPTADIPADPNPGRIFDSPTVFGDVQLYRRLTPGLVYFNEQGTIKSVAVVNTSEWWFFTTGRVLVRFKNYHAGPFYPTTVAEVTTSWGAYRIEPKPSERDILHLYADNSLFMETDTGERAEMTLEDGRRHLFWEKDYQILSAWAAEQKPVPCASPANSDSSLANTGVSLSTTIAPDEIQDPGVIPFKLTGPVAGMFTLSGSMPTAGTLVVEHAISLRPPVDWQPFVTNRVVSGPFSFPIPQGTNNAAYFRLRGPE
jgi:hypothetical protein